MPTRSAAPAVVGRARNGAGGAALARELRPDVVLMDVGMPVLNGIDDRNEVQGKERVQQYFSIVETEPGWEQKLDRERVEEECDPANFLSPARALELGVIDGTISAPPSPMDNRQFVAALA